MAVTFLRLLRDGVVHEDPSHRLRRDAKKVGAVLPVDAIEPEQLHVRLVHETGRVQRMVPPLPAALSPGDPLELLIQDRKQPIDRGPAPAADILHQLADVVAVRREPLHIHGCSTQPVVEVGSACEPVRSSFRLSETTAGTRALGRQGESISPNAHGASPDWRVWTGPGGSYEAADCGRGLSVD